MKFGVRQITDVVFKAKTSLSIGGKTFAKGQPVLYIDSAKTSTVEGAATTVYATGGKGNTRLIAWEGQKTLTFTVEDALLSPISFAMLSGAGLFKGTASEDVHFHQTTTALAGYTDGVIDLTDALESAEKVDSTAPIYVMVLDEYNDITGDIVASATVDETGKKITAAVAAGKTVMVDYYVTKKANTVSELQIDAEHFAGYYYVEASTLFRRQADGKDLPANITFPNVKIQSNFTFSMASSGDPSTFTFTMDCFPGYTYFDKTKKVLCAMQIVYDATVKEDAKKSIFPHKTGFQIGESTSDSVTGDNETISS